MDCQFGNFDILLPAGKEYLTLHFSPSSAPRQQRWRNYGLSADFLGDYFAAFFPGESVPEGKLDRRGTVKAAVTYIANELLENAIKHNDKSSEEPVCISLYLQEERIVFQVVNYIGLEQAEKFGDFIRQVLAVDDIDALYMQQLEKAAMGAEESNMGILTMMNDYGVRFGWKFKSPPEEPALVRVDVLACLDIE